MIRTLYRAPDKSIEIDLPSDRIKSALQHEGGILWCDITCPPHHSEAAAALLADTFAFHPLAIEDALQQIHVPRIDDWDTYLYIVVHALILTDGELENKELDIFLGPNYLVTIHEQPLKQIDNLWNQCCQGKERNLSHGPARLLYQLAEDIVSDYMSIVDELDEQLDDVEDQIFQVRNFRMTNQSLGQIFRIRRTVLKVRRNLGYLREVVSRLARDGHQVVPRQDFIYFRDIYDHLVRMYDIVDGLRDMAIGALDSYMSVTSNRINETMRALTVVTVLFMPLSFLTGFMGMNFFADAYNIENPFPPVSLFGVCLGVMVFTPLVMLVWMIRRGWLVSSIGTEEQPSHAVDSR